MNDTLRIKRVLPRFDSIVTSTGLEGFVARLVAANRGLGCDWEAKYIAATATVKGRQREFSRPLPPQHFDREEHDLIGCGGCGFRRRATLGAATSEPALLSVQRPRGLPPDVAEARGDEGEDDEMLHGKRHGQGTKN